MTRRLLITSVLSLTAFIMFGFISKLFKGDKSATKSSVVLGMALLNDVPKLDFQKITEELKTRYGLTLTNPETGDEKSAVMRLNGSTIAIMLLDVPIPGDELEFPSKISYLWPEAKDLTPKHKAHIIISVSSSEDDKLTMFRTFTKVAAAVLTHSNAFGIYLGNQTLVLPTSFFVEGANSMTEDSLPLMNWIYIGLRGEDGKNSGYTFGLAEFGLPEIEILNSQQSKEDIHEMLSTLSHYVILNNIVLRDGETIGMSEEQKLRIRKSKGVQVDGTTLKVEY